MSITVLYFASLREALDVERESIELSPETNTVGAIRAALIARGEAWAALASPRIRAAVNQTLASDASGVADGDEIAFFPPVTGG